jgi:hypothetical protein
VWGRGADSKWKVGHTAVPGQFDTVPPKAQSMPHILGKFDMFTVAVVAARVALRASGMEEERNMTGLAMASPLRAP